ncbi:MAG: outer membrane beta-barrel protein [Elusimicrobia bacterium]|nr:outer membrane beta-barrel protein [Elusimicrobiota bacterium]
MKKSLLALVLAVALAVPVLAENMWVGGSFSYSSQDLTITDGDDYPVNSTVSWSIEPEFGYSLNEKWDIGLDLSYSSNNGVTEIYGWDLNEWMLGPDDTVSVTEMGIAPFARFHVAKIAGVDVMLKGSIVYVKGELKAWGESVDYSAYGVAIAPIISYSINETWSIGATLNFAELSYIHAEIDDGSGIKPKTNAFGFNANDGSLINIGFSYHF